MVKLSIIYSTIDIEYRCIILYIIDYIPDTYNQYNLIPLLYSIICV